ncbi:hypothetical protein LWM68_23660 [Niabella sp. W65]|nr:hypothetical protein [Niabella sp. W65]MCH7365503.1 hypothetical protein [Niabella sp. W65]ULT41291.1 hypothetical protein KRR40_42555 [Niabella sp. I65]
MKFLTALCLLLTIPFLSQARLQLPWFFSDNMVLQQQSTPSIWGWTDKKMQLPSSHHGTTESIPPGPMKRANGK